MSTPHWSPGDPTFFEGFTEPGLQVEGWVKAQPSNRRAGNRRVLRQRTGKRSRLTTKTPNERKKR